MSNMSTIKKSILTAICIALCVVLPMAFHSIQNAGSISCPALWPHLRSGTRIALWSGGPAAIQFIYQYASYGHSSEYDG